MKTDKGFVFTSKKLIAIVLTLAFAAGTIISPAGSYAEVYAAESAPSAGTAESVPLAITAQPSNVTVQDGGLATFSVEATGTGLKYQWYYRKSGGRKWSIWSGRTTSVISDTADSSWDMMRVYCRITDASGSTVSSNSAVVRIAVPIVVLSQPKNVTVKPGGRMKFSVSAQGTGAISYQWYMRKADMDEGTVWSGHTSSTVSAVADDTCNLMQVWCVMTDEAGSSAQSQTAVVSVSRALTILTQPEDVTVKVGRPTGISLSAQGTGGLSYQWYYKKYGVNDWSVWISQTSAEITAKSDATWNMMQTYCRITDETGAQCDSRTVVIRIDQPLAVVSHPLGKSVVSGRAANLSVSVRGKGEYTYQWFRRMPNARVWEAWTGQNGAVLSAKIEQSMDGVLVFCRIWDESRTSVNTRSARITVIPAITILSQPSQVTVHAGENASFFITASGSGLRYQWYRKKAGETDWTLWKDSTSATVSEVADCTWHAMQVFCRVIDEAGETADSAVTFAMITKKDRQIYINRTFTVNGNGTKVYSGPGTNHSTVGTVYAGAKYLALEWACDAGDSTWYRFDLNGRSAWIPRTKTTVFENECLTIPNRSFKDGGVPIIYLSPSRQTKNEYAAGATTEGDQMYRVGNELKKILEEEYLCVVYMPPVSMKINFNCRPTDAYNKEADVYLAIHSNAHSSRTMYGAVGYYFPGSEQSKALGENMAEEMGKISPFTPTVSSKTVDGMKGFDNVGYAEVRDPAYYGMISLLAEVEYHDNADSARWIIDNPKNIARALANALEKTIDMQKK